MLHDFEFQQKNTVILLVAGLNPTSAALKKMKIGHHLDVALLQIRNMWLHELKCTLFV
jgi:hypothetical protein